MMGLRVIVDEQMPIVGATGDQEQFVCYLFGNGAVATGNQFPLRIETERNIASLQDAVAVHYSNCMHVPGTTWAAATDNPGNAGPDHTWQLGAGLLRATSDPCCPV